MHKKSVKRARCEQFGTHDLKCTPEKRPTCIDLINVHSSVRILSWRLSSLRRRMTRNNRKKLMFTRSLSCRQAFIYSRCKISQQRPGISTSRANTTQVMLLEYDLLMLIGNRWCSVQKVVLAHCKPSQNTVLRSVRDIMLRKGLRASQEKFQSKTSSFLPREHMRGRSWES